jgi:hypothetical protein
LIEAPSALVNVAGHALVCDGRTGPCARNVPTSSPGGAIDGRRSVLAIWRKVEGDRGPIAVDWLWGIAANSPDRGDRGGKDE